MYIVPVAMILRLPWTADAPLIAAMIRSDDEHWQQGMTPDFFLRPPQHSIPLCFEDQYGPVFFVRLDMHAPAVRVHIQFSADFRRTARMLEEGFAFIAEKCREAGAQKMVFESKSRPLRIFCIKKFGFRELRDSDDLELRLQDVVRSITDGEKPLG